MSFLLLQTYTYKYVQAPTILRVFLKGIVLALRWLFTIPENVKLLRTHSPVIKFILNTPKTEQCEYFQEKHEGLCCT